ncbi:hypothetical protein E3N88_38750 [Mikania micrantha]|uniref:DUF7610 domain-containing protein n=1 Tax=Mikania micrantha TaxID=192012 RepID=A0A5N6LUW0_9ASTR|nr:hypothetical protein E3N88_38750 [Mikania micrantha]
MLQTKLEEIEAEIANFIGLPINKPLLNLLAQRIETKFGFIGKLLNAEMASNGTKPDELPDIEEKLKELEAKFCVSKIQRLDVDESSEGENISSSGSDSICESCLNYDGVGDNEAPEAAVRRSGTQMVGRKFECMDGGETGWWRTVAVTVFTTVSAALMCLKSTGLPMKGHEIVTRVVCIVFDTEGEPDARDANVESLGKVSTPVWFEPVVTLPNFNEQNHTI